MISAVNWEADMSNDNQELLRLQQAEEAFRAAAAAPAFVAACQKLRALSGEYESASEALKKAEQEHAKVVRPVHLSALDTARRAAQGIAGLGDLGKAVFSRKKTPQETETSAAVETAAALEARLR